MNHNHNSMPSQFRGVYGRVARKIGVDVSYVSRVARGERQSKRIADALQQAIGRIVRKNGGEPSGLSSCPPPRKSRALCLSLQHPAARVIGGEKLRGLCC